MPSRLSKVSCLAALLVFIVTASPARAQSNLQYQQPPKAITDLIEAPPTPSVILSPAAAPAKKYLLIGALSALPTIADLAQPEYRLAGLRFNPKTNGPSRGRYFTSLRLKPLPDGPETPVANLPSDAKIRVVAWSPDARSIYFINVTDSAPNAGLSLWIIDAASAQARQISGVALNGMFPNVCEWLSDSQSLLCRTVPQNRGPAPQRDETPTGPVIQENLGRVTPGATYEDLLKSPEDERIFDYYATSQLALIRLDGTATPIGQPAVFVESSPSPDGHFALLDERHHPYSYVQPFERFPERASVIDLKSGKSQELVDKPLADSIPNVHDAVPTGPRAYEWRADAPGTIFWAEAADGGDPRKEAPVRDTLYLLEIVQTAALRSDRSIPEKVTFTRPVPRKIAELSLRYEGISWSSGSLALVEERRWKDRKRIILAVAPQAAGPSPAAGKVLYEGSFEDRYHDPGRPFEVQNAFGKAVLQTTTDAQAIYFHSNGASPQGDQPFVSTISVKDGAAKHIWQSAAPNYEVASAITDAATPTLLIRRESPDQNPNYLLLNAAKSSVTQVTNFPNPYGSQPLPKKQVLKYKRADGVELSANLYLPPGYDPKSSGPLPTLLEAYPTEYKTKSAAGQITGSPYEFPSIYWGSPIPFVTQGFAVLENATIPIIGEGSAEPNDTYVEQLVASAKAAIDEGARLGVVDPKRVAVMGHSYGAFMTVNLLAHSDLFRAGIARSGAYNRTLTPFGFQNEDRTYWQAPEIYYKMSPFSYADKIKTPLLLIHGEADNNSGTFPIQSERLFNAIKGHGGTVRFVLLPLESHGYQGRESVLHMFWEMNNWLTTYVKNPPPTAPATASATTAK